MDEVKQQLQRYKKENSEIEGELRGAFFDCTVKFSVHDLPSENANIEQKVRLWESRAAENMETIENLREERSLLATQYKELQQRFSEVSEVYTRHNFIFYLVLMCFCRLQTSYETNTFPMLILMTIVGANWTSSALRSTTYAGH